jgi:hypothetical protein
MESLFKIEVSYSLVKKQSWNLGCGVVTCDPKAIRHLFMVVFLGFEQEM